MRCWFVVIVLMLAGCQPKQAKQERSAAPVASAVPAPPVVTVKGALGDRARLPTRGGEPKVVDVDAQVLAKLQDGVAKRAGMIAAQRSADAIEITLGGPPDDGFLITVVADGARVERRMPPASHPAEALTNFDHTLGAALDDLGLERLPRQLTAAP